MIRFWYNLAPNPMKVALMLEELGVEYEAIPVGVSTALSPLRSLNIAV